jgi:SAM-dependent methyltransferase
MHIDHGNLEDFADADNYDLEDDSDTGVAFYADLAHETGGPVLEIGCGTGRVSIPIARQGLVVTGLDIVPGMLERARRKSASLPVRWVQGDGRDFELAEQFRLIFLTGNAFQLFLTRTDQQALLEQAHRHLHEDGLFAFETRNPCWRQGAASFQDAQALSHHPFPNAEGLFAYLETWEAEETDPPYTDSQGRQIHRSRTQEYDHVSQILQWTGYRRWQENGQEQTRISRLAVRYTFPQELDALLHYNGFQRERCYGDWDCSPLTIASPSIISVCRKRTQ